MKVTLLGYPQSGQQQLFSLLTKLPLENVISKPLEAHQGICEVRDPRIIKLVEMYNPKKTAFAKIEYLLLPDFNLQGPSKALLLNSIKNADELCFIVKSDSAETDISKFLSELIISDLIFVEKRLETIDKDSKKRAKDIVEKEKILLALFKSQLEAEKPVGELELNEEQISLSVNYQLLTLKPIVVVVNIPESEINTSKAATDITGKFKVPSINVSIEIEEQMNSLSDDERGEFMKEMGIIEAAINKMNRITFEGLGLISYFTVGEDEVRAWPIQKGSSAQKAGGAIHSDIEKGFVRAEMFKYDDLIFLGSEAKIKEMGKFSLKGKEYIVDDGDILSFRFNV